MCVFMVETFVLSTTFLKPLSLSLFLHLSHTHADMHAQLWWATKSDRRSINTFFSPAIRLKRILGGKTEVFTERNDKNSHTRTTQNTFSAGRFVCCTRVLRNNWLKQFLDGKKRGTGRTRSSKVFIMLQNLLSQVFLPVMKPEICRGSWPSVTTAISSWPRDNQNNSRLFRSVSTSAKSGSCTDGEGVR